ncbi:O-succinylhomoserine sulfhydrylase [Gilvimarinus agarilyticus]|uniref:O-succinylhomoserine sulfhydrylase n=1 Tax=unclassified Gilvimarinus TaxID=2642066 RepID=UPI001C0A611C|nr:MULTISPECIES: O-succinylhomoserine sulfhydrylase [unclassified Gilvimarinus]MBU2885092.1 O-succinylhomoserine sulfhydrylase [Gilvimarinus agarilyticus]MDO6569989.1 O-succinylhomoserine sulfhydrylase [Gilvimarinus sp. 2_MG-2023]MDO6747255.1 O-succinylhomoserine sulfhydrylase [Gilvimarinus sp. 1_MG-2023]
MSDASDLNEALQGAGIDTLAVRAGQVRSDEGEHSEALYLTSSYVFADAQEAADRFSGDQPGNVYSRYTNPTVRTLEARIAALEGAESAVATASGMAAILATCMAFLQAGDQVVCSRSVFGTTTVLFTKYMSRFGVETVFVDPTDFDQWQAGISTNTKLVFVETPSNPLCDIVDIARLADVSHQAGALLVVDNCFCTPALQKPLEFGADIVVHSATKYIDGQGRCLGGLVVGAQVHIEEVLGFIRSAGPTMSPFNAWVFLKGLETLRLRMDAHSANAMALARWLEAQPAVEKVFYAGLAHHPGHALAAKQQRGFGGVLSFRVKGGREQAWQVIDATKILSLTANLGDAKTTIVHPATTTHGRLSDAQRAETGITENLIRIAVGLEDVQDIQADLERGLTLI